MRFHVLTLFPEMIDQGLHTSILGRAMEHGYLTVETTNIRDFSTNKFHRVDDYPYGGGAGMVMEAEPVFRAYQTVEEKIRRKPRTIYLTPQGRVLNQTMVEELALEEDLVLLCGHYEGIDDRVLQEVVTDYISIGDYVLTGGELAAMVLIDAVSRFVPGVLSNEESSQFESLQGNLLEYPHYTRPEEWHGKKVPEVLLTGDHRKIDAWRHEASFERTKERRPDLLENAFLITCACDKTQSGTSEIHDLMNALTRYGKSLDLARKKIRKQKNRFGAKDLLILHLPMEPAPDAPVADRNEYTANFWGEETPLILILSGGEHLTQEQWREKSAEVESELCAHGFLTVALIRGIPRGEGLKRFSFALREQIYTGRWKNEKILASADAL
ncbi:MAG: tRNA (guanosine(37)-N1)-methyltransferase TrmD [Fusicatenibacter sp.]